MYKWKNIDWYTFVCSIFRSFFSGVDSMVNVQYQGKNLCSCAYIFVIQIRADYNTLLFKVKKATLF